MMMKTIFLTFATCVSLLNAESEYDQMVDYKGAGAETNKNTAAVKSSDAEREISLTLPDNILTLPKVASKRHIVWKPTGWDDLTMIHNTFPTIWKDTVFVSWYTTKRGEASPDYFLRVAQAPLTNLSNFVTYDPSQKGEGAMLATILKQNEGKIPDDIKWTVNHTPRCFLPTKDRLYFFESCYVWPSKEYLKATGLVKQPFFGKFSFQTMRIFYLDDPKGEWQEIPYSEMQVMRKFKGFILDYPANHHFIQLRDGRLLSPNMKKPYMTSDPTGLSGWNDPVIKFPALKMWHEPSAYEGPDGVLHWNIRVSIPTTYSPWVWSSYSTDGGTNWTALKPQMHFPDNPGNKEFGSLPNGWVWYVGNPLQYTDRTQLVLGFSKDGWVFDNNYLVRWESVFDLKYPADSKSHQPGYEYPSACYYDGKLYITYSNFREAVSLDVVDLSTIKGYK